MKKFLSKIVASAVFAGITGLGLNVGHAAITEIAPHVFTDPAPQDEWHLNSQNNVILVGKGSPIFPEKNTHYIARNTIKYGTMKDGRLFVKCNFYDSYEFAIMYPGKKKDGTHRARFFMRDAVSGNDSPFEIDPVLAPFNGTDVEPFPKLNKVNPIPARVVEMLYFIVKGDKYYGDLQPADYVRSSNDILNPYTPDLYERCKKY